MICLTISYGDKHLKTYELEDSAVTVGRLPENTISIANMGISRRHFKIDVDADRNYVLTDLNSLNGVCVNYKKVKTAILSSGDLISVGKYKILFAVHHQPPPPEPRITDTDLAFKKDDALATAEIAALESGHENAQMDETLPPAPEENGENVEDVDLGASSPVPVLIETGKHIVYKIDRPAVTMGSSESDDIFVSGFMIGGGHVVVEREKGGVWIRAKKMMGKFRVNGHKVKNHLLAHKDRIEIGNNTFRYMENG